MKRILSVIAALACSTAAQAAFIQCDVEKNLFVSGVNQGAVNFTCAAVNATVGFDIVSAQLRMIGAFSDASGDGITHQLNFAALENSSQFVIASFNGNTGIDAFGSNTGVLNSAIASFVVSPTLNSFTVTVNATDIGNGPPASATATIFLQTTEQAQAGAVPEPTTFVLLGAGLVGLGIYRRRIA